ncbi:hypothetical protein ES708_26094 [subsurface metagenome]
MQNNQEYIKGTVELNPIGLQPGEGEHGLPPLDHTPGHTDETGEGAGFPPPRSIGLHPMHAHELPGKRNSTV